MQRVTPPKSRRRSGMSSPQSIHSVSDGYIDIIAGGNKFGILPQFGRLDASYGHVLINNKNGAFTWEKPAESGIIVPGETKNIISFNKGNNKYFLFLRNNDYPIIYELINKTSQAK